MTGDTFRVMFGVTFGMLTAKLRIGDFQLILSVVVWKDMKTKIRTQQIKGFQSDRDHRHTLFRFRLYYLAKCGAGPLPEDRL